ncbi:MAG: hypothetical protein KDC87_18600, partial [Planctomycetes bacterium]|nr:hypothetical protein [Planctomycetota bacterium]
MADLDSRYPWHRGTRPWTGVLAAVLLAAALRREADLGDVVPGWAYWVLFALGVIMLAATNGSGADPVPPQRGSRWLLGLGSVWLLALPSHAALATSGLGLTMLLAAAVRWGRLARGIAVAAMSWLVLVGVAELGEMLALMRLGVPWVAEAVVWILRFAGADARLGDGVLVLAGPDAQQAFRATGNTVGLSTHLGIAAVLACGAWCGGLRRVSWWQPVLYLLLALPLRLSFVIGVAVTLQHGVKYDDPHFPMQAFLDWRWGLAIDGVTALMVSWVSLRATQPNPVVEQTPPRLLHPFTAALALLLGLLWSADRVLDCRAEPKAGRIAIDEGHSRWESSDLRLTRDHYGQESGYNMRGLADWLGVHYGQIRRLYQAIDDAVLQRVDVLVLKTPTQKLSPAERQCIDAFVRRGGGLILIGDHTNVYGTSEVLNEIAVPYGFRFEYDCFFDHRNRFEFCYRSEPWVRNHPILRGLDTILFEVGCTIDIDSPRVRPILVGRSLKSQPIDFGVENFYGTPRDTSEQRTGQFPLVVTRAVGRGRVVAISDSTLFSTFSVFQPGRREIVEGMVAYADHRDCGSAVRDGLCRAALAAFALLLLLCRGAGVGVFVTAFVAAWGSGHGSIALAEAWYYPGNPDLRRAAAGSEVSFVWEDHLAWPVFGFTKDQSRCFDLMFQFAARCRAFPRLERNLHRALRAGGPVVWIDPGPSDAETALAE